MKYKFMYIVLYYIQFLITCPLEKNVDIVKATEVTLFHLYNKMANHKIDIFFDGQVITNSWYPKYLGVTLDGTLTYKKHLTKTAAKLKTRNNIIQKLANSEYQQ